MLEESLKKTLPSLPTTDDAGLSLPTGQLNPEETLALALKDMANLAKREGRTTGLAATSAFFDERGIRPEDLPGGSIAQMIAFVDRAMVDPVQERADSITDMLGMISAQRQELQGTANRQITMMMNQGMWNGLLDSNPEQARELWTAAGFLGSPYRMSESAGDWRDMSISEQLPGFTLQETYDIRYRDNAPDWYLEKVRNEIIQSEGKDAFGDLMKIPGEEKSYARLRDSKTFMDRAEQDWLSLKRSPTGSHFMDPVTGGAFLPQDVLRQQLIGSGKSYMTLDDIKSDAHKINTELGLGLSVTQINVESSRVPLTFDRAKTNDLVNSVYERALHDAMRNKMSDEEIVERAIEYLVAGQEVHGYSDKTIANAIEVLLQRYAPTPDVKEQIVDEMWDSLPGVVRLGMTWAYSVWRKKPIEWMVSRRLPEELK